VFSDEFQTEFMVDMSCEGCVKSVRTKLEPLEGVKSVDVDLGNQVVRVLGSATVKNLSAALAQSGRKARLIGQGLPENFALSAAVAEFKGPEIHGVVRFVQVSMELARIEASFSGLPPGSHGWSINEYGDLTRGAASTGQIFNTSTNQQDVPVGDLGVLEANEGGDAEYSGTKEMLKVGDLIGRALVVYGDHDKSRPGTSAAVIARSAGVGENYKKLCSCDGTVIWESTPNDYARV
jgi:copper chaperone for superoxide dismutase